MELTFTHKFPGDTDATVMKIKLVEKGNPPAAALEFSGSDKNGTTNSDTTLNNIVRAMKEQGRVDVGYGDISNRDTLLDTFTGGLNVLTGLNSDTVNKMSDADAKKEVEERLLNSPIFLLGQAVNACNTRLDEGQSNCVEFSEKMGVLIDKATLTHSRVGTVYSDIGTKWATMDGLETKHKKTSQNLQEQYKDKLGADPYESIMEMFSYQYSYSASLQMGSKLMQSSLFDFLR
jgi:flagellar hook-associated protein 3 FlgL